MKPRSVTRKRPKQARAQLSVAAMLEAAEKIILTEGSAAVTTTRIAEVAGVSVGSLYQYFSDKGSLLVVLAETYMEKDLALFLSLHADKRGVGFEALVEELATAMLEQYARNASVRAVLIEYLYATGSSHVMRRIFAVYEEQIASLAEPFFSHLPRATLAQRAFIAFHAAEGAMRETALRQIPAAERRKLAKSIAAGFTGVFLSKS